MLYSSARIQPPPLTTNISLNIFNHLVMNDLSGPTRCGASSCARSGLIILFELNEDKGKTNLLLSCTVGPEKMNWVVHILLSAIISVRFPSVCVSAKQAFAKIPLDSSKLCQTSFPGLTGNLSLGVQDYNLCKPLVNGNSPNPLTGQPLQGEYWLRRWPIPPKTNTCCEEWNKYCERDSMWGAEEHFTLCFPTVAFGCITTVFRRWEHAAVKMEVQVSLKVQHTLLLQWSWLLNVARPSVWTLCVHTHIHTPSSLKSIYSTYNTAQEWTIII